MLPAFLACGLGTWAGFLYIGSKARRRSWLWTSALYGVGAIVLWVLFSSVPVDESGETVEGTWQDTVSGVYLFALWGIGILHTLVVHPRWLEWRRRPDPAGLLPVSSPTHPYAVAQPVPVPVPGGVGEPWAEFVRDAEAARLQFRSAAAGVRPGPLRDSLWGLAERIDASVHECRRIAGTGEALAAARRGIDVTGIDEELAQAQGRRAERLDDERLAATIAALEAQRSTAARMDEVIDDTVSRLRLLDARLGEAVARMLELSAQSVAAGADPSVLALSSDVDSLVGDLEALRQAVEETHTPDALHP